jgi:hypothetical protein
MAEVGIDILGGGSDGGGIIKVDGEILDIAAFTFEETSGTFRRRPITLAMSRNGTP